MDRFERRMAKAKRKVENQMVDVDLEDGSQALNVPDPPKKKRGRPPKAVLESSGGTLASGGEVIPPVVGEGSLPLHGAAIPASAVDGKLPAADAGGSPRSSSIPVEKVDVTPSITLPDVVESDNNQGDTGGDGVIAKPKATPKRKPPSPSCTPEVERFLHLKRMR